MKTIYLLYSRIVSLDNSLKLSTFNVKLSTCRYILYNKGDSFIIKVGMYITKVENFIYK